MNIIDVLRKDSPALSRSAFDVRGKAADAIEELLVVLTRWQAAWDWADETVIANASESLLSVVEDTDKVLRGYGIREASKSVSLVQYTTQLDASGRDTSQLTRTSLVAAEREARGTA